MLAAGARADVLGLVKFRLRNVAPCALLVPIARGPTEPEADMTTWLLATEDAVGPATVMVCVPTILIAE